MSNLRAARRRWWVHLGLLLAAIISLVFEFVLTVHIVLGVAFIVLVAAHLVQRHRISSSLARRLVRLSGWSQKAGRMATADALLLALTLAMLASGFVHVAIGYPTKIRWHALTGVALAVYLHVHTLRRRTRLKSSKIR